MSKAEPIDYQTVTSPSKWRRELIVSAIVFAVVMGGLLAVLLIAGSTFDIPNQQ